MRYALIRNPRSGRGASAKAWPAIEARLQGALAGHNLSVEETTGPGSAIAQAKRFADQGFDVVIGAGGDGTISDVTQGLVGTEAALGVLPLGTGNDYCRMIGIGPDIDLAIDALAADRRLRIDLAKWSLGSGENGYSLNVAGCGFDAVVADRVNRGFRRLRGTTAYIAAVLQSLSSYRPTELTITADGETIQCKAMLCAVANCSSYGGGMKIAPNASLQDGLLDLVLVGELGRIEFLMNFPKVMKGAHITHPKVVCRTAKRVEIRSDSPVPYLVDGEVLPPGDFAIEIVPAALTAVVP